MAATQQTAKPVRVAGGKFAKGSSGNPGGMKKMKPWAEALETALSEKTLDGRTKLVAVAEAVVNAAIDGDMVAAKEIGDRLDGKAVQAIIGDKENPIYIGTTDAERDARLLELLRKAGANASP